MKFEPPRADLGRAEQRVQVRVEPDVDVDGRGLELADRAAGPRRTAAGASEVTVVCRPNRRQSAATASATAIAVGFDAASGAMSSMTYGFLVPGAAQPPASRFQPAALRSAVARLRSNLTGLLALRSNAHDDGGIGESARVAAPPKTVAMIAFRSIDASRPWRRSAFRSSALTVRRLSAMAVRVVRG